MYSEHNPGELTSAVSALDDLTIIGQPSIGQAFKIVFGISGPTILVAGALWLVGEKVTDNIFTVQLALEVNEADDVLAILRL